MTGIHITECDGCKRREAEAASELRNAGNWEEILVPQDSTHRDLDRYMLCPDCFRRFEQVVLV